ncbi:MAG: NAD-dependent epimerase/dehydratase family protein [Opitutaceae bacterium]
MAPVIVTGAAGFIGSHTCDLLLAAGHPVVGVDNFRTGQQSNIAQASKHPYFRFIQADCCAPGVLQRIVAESRPSVLIHLAALTSVQESVRNPNLNFELNLLLTHLVAEAARVHGIARVVFASSAAVYGASDQLPLNEHSLPRPISPYGAAKLASEALLLGYGAAFGISIFCLRYFNVYGPRQDPNSPYSGVISIFSDKLRAGVAPIIFGDGEQTRDFIHVQDIARANVLAATAPSVTSLIANICTGRATSLNQLAAGFRTRFPCAPLPMHVQTKAADIRHSLGTPNAAEASFGFSAQVELVDGLATLAR